MIEVSEPEPVRLLIVMDWDAGFQLTARSALPDVEPGDEYVTECKPQRTVVVREVIVEGFSLVEISVGAKKFQATTIDEGSRRVYQLDPELVATPDDWVRVQLCNDTDVPRKQKMTTLVRSA